MKLAAIVLLNGLLLAASATAQQRTFYDAAGRPAGHAATDSQGTTTIYDARGNVTNRASTSGNTTTTYDAAGRRVGTVSHPGGR